MSDQLDENAIALWRPSDQHPWREWESDKSDDVRGELRDFVPLDVVASTYAPYRVERRYEGCYEVLNELDEPVATVAKFMPGPMVSVRGQGVYSPQLARAIAAAMSQLAGEMLKPEYDPGRVVMRDLEGHGNLESR